MDTNREILSAVTAVILIIALVTVIVGVLIIGRKRLYTLSHVSVLDWYVCLTCVLISSICCFLKQ